MIRKIERLKCMVFIYKRILFGRCVPWGSVESPTVGILLIDNGYMRWDDGYQMFCLFTLARLGALVTRLPRTAKIREPSAQRLKFR